MLQVDGGQRGKWAGAEEDRARLAGVFKSENIPNLTYSKPIP